jgi:hypothetical protein
MITILPQGPVRKSGLYPAAASFAGLRTGSAPGKRRAARKRIDPGKQLRAQQAAYAKQAAKEAKGKALIAQAEADLAVAKAMGMTLGEYDKAMRLR